MHEGILSHWLVTIMRTSLRSMAKVVTYVLVSHTSSGEHGASANSNSILILRICIKISIDICAGSIRIASYSRCYLYKLAGHWYLRQIWWLGHLIQIGNLWTASHISTRIEDEVARFPQHLCRRMKLLVMFLDSWWLKLRWHAICRLFCRTLVLLKLFHAVLLCTWVCKLVDYLLCIIFIHLFFLHLQIILCKALL